MRPECTKMTHCFLFYIFMCMCDMPVCRLHVCEHTHVSVCRLHVCEHACVGVCMYTHIHGDPKVISGIICNFPSSLLIESGFPSQTQRSAIWLVLF